MSSKIARLACAGVVALILYACHMKNVDSVPPSITSVAGIYYPASYTVEYIVKQGKYKVKASSIRILLKDNKTAVLSNIPDWWVNLGQNNGRLYTATGKWDIVKSDEQWSVKMDLKWPHMEEIAYAQLVGNPPDYELLLVVGDPDNRDAMVFLREGKNTR